MAVNINLYPPVINAYMPAFLIGSSDIQKNICKVYFSISSYNSLNSIKNAQITVTNQNTNLSVLNRAKYPCEIMLTDIKVDLTKTSDDKYYIEIKNNDIEGGFQINQYYKVQIRFTAIEAENPPSNIGIPPSNWDETNQKYTDAQAIDSWLAANLSNFSEWSTVCLVRGISVPSLNIIGFDTSADETILSVDQVDLIGKIIFANSEEKDTLKSYQIKLYDKDNILLTDSGILYTNTYSNINEFNYVFEYAFKESENYYFTFEYETANMYNEINRYDFIVIQEGAEKLEATLTGELDYINGCIRLHIVNAIGQESFVGNITIRRTSSESNFMIWEDIHTESFKENSKLDYIWYDYTIKSGVYYKYIIQKRTSVGTRGIAVHAEGEPFMMLFDDMYLTGEKGQLNIRFDPSVNSFKRTVSESRTDTIGSKYPFIKRNGYIEYRQFPIGGTITHLMDPSHLITSKEEVFKDSLNYYNDFNKDKNVRIDDFNDWTYEREFREKVMDFLYDNKVKLFRSPTEGNILVKIMDINFTPNATLGRRIYSFAATAYEVDAANIKNYNKYGISPLGTYNTQLQFTSDYIGQYNEIIPANIEILNLIQDKYKKYAKENYVMSIQNLDSLRLEFETDPYLIKENSNGPYIVDDLGEEKENPTSAILGYLVYINNQPIVVNPEGIYELKDKNIEITSLSFPIETKVNIEYHVNFKQVEDTSTIFQTSNFYKRVGQKWGAFKPNDSIYQSIWNKYFEKYSDYQQVMLSLDGIKIEAEPGTVVYVKESTDKNFERHVIGSTHTLIFDAKDSAIEGLYFSGIHLEPATIAEQERETLPNNKYVDTGITLDRYVSDTSSLIKNGVYTLADDYLEVLNQTEQNNIMTSDFIDEDGGIIVDEEWIEEINTDYSLTLGENTDKQYALILQRLIDETNSRFIWYNNKWWLFTNNDDLLCPVEALIDYYCEIMKGRYAE